MLNQILQLMNSFIVKIRNNKKGFQLPTNKPFTQTKTNIQQARRIECFSNIHLFNYTILTDSIQCYRREQATS